jgi:hypothetical protein
MRRFILLALFVLCTSVAVPSIASATCNAATIQGTYAVVARAASQ